MTNRRGRRSTKKKHDLPLTEEMLNELNKNSLSGYGHHGMGHSAPGMTERHHPSTMNGGGYDNYGQDPDDFYDMEDVWNNDRYNFGQSKYKVNEKYLGLSTKKILSTINNHIYF